MTPRHAGRGKGEKGRMPLGGGSRSLWRSQDAPDQSGAVGSLPARPRANASPKSAGS